MKVNIVYRKLSSMDTQMWGFLRNVKNPLIIAEDSAIDTIETKKIENEIVATVIGINNLHVQLADELGIRKEVLTPEEEDLLIADILEDMVKEGEIDKNINPFKLASDLRVVIDQVIPGEIVLDLNKIESNQTREKLSLIYEVVERMENRLYDDETTSAILKRDLINKISNSAKLNYEDIFVLELDYYDEYRIKLLEGLLNTSSNLNVEFKEQDDDSYIDQVAKRFEQTAQNNDNVNLIKRFTDDEVYTNNMNVYAFENAYKEAEFIANGIKGLLKSGTKAKDIAVISSHDHTISDLVEKALLKNDIYVNKAYGSILGEFRVYKAVLALAKMIDGIYSYDSILGLLEASNRLEEHKDLIKYLDRFGGNDNNGSKYDYDSYLLKEAILSEYQTLVKSVLLEETDGISAIYRLLQELKIDDLVVDDAKSYQETNRVRADEQIVSWNKMMDVLKSYRQKEAFDSENFLKYIEDSGKNKKVSTDNNYNNLVAITDVNDALNRSAKHIFLASFNDRVYPVEYSPIFFNRNDMKEQEIIQGRIKNQSIAQDETRYQYERLLYAPNIDLKVSYSVKDIDGKEVLISSLLEQEEIQEVDKNTTLIDIIKELSLGNNKKAQDMLYAADLTESDIEKLEFALRFENTNHGVINSNRASEVFRSKKRFSVSTVESHNRCPLTHFIENGIRPQGRKVLEEDVMERGTFFHQLFEDLFRYMIDNSIDFHTVTREDLDPVIETVIKDASLNHNEGLHHSNEKMKFKYSLIHEGLKNSLWYSIEQIQAGDFVPEGVEFNVANEHSFNNRYKDYYISGIIDRFDVANINGEKFARTVDYKSSGRKIDKDDLKKGTQLQLFVYMHLLRQNGYKPAGMYYYPISNSSLENSSLKDFKLSGVTVLNEEVFEAIDKELANKSGVNSEIVKINYTKKGILGSAAEVESEEKLEEYIDLAMSIFDETVQSIRSGYTEINPILEFNPYGYDDPYKAVYFQSKGASMYNLEIDLDEIKKDEDLIEEED